MLTLQEMIGWQALTGLITSPAGGIPANILPPAFLNVTRQVNGDTGSFKIVSGNRELARLVHMGDPSVEADTGVIGERAFKCLHTFEHLRHKAAVLANLTSYENEQRQRLAADEIDRKTGEFRQRLNNLRLAATYSALLNGAIWFDKNGRMLISNSGAVTTIDYAVDAACKGNITGTSNVLLAGSTAKWSTAGTKIVDQVAALLDFSVEQSGYEIAYAFYGKNVPGYIVDNTQVAKLLVNNGPKMEQLMSGVIPDGFLGVKKWMPVNRCWFYNAAGVLQRIASDDAVVWSPEPSPEWWETVEGSDFIPTDLGKVSADAQSALGTLQEVFGMFSYATVQDDPAGVKHYMGDTFIPLQKVTKAVLNTKVHW